MKISELNTQSFLGGTNVPANSYVLINYADSAGGTPVTKKVSVQELGKAIANDQQLYKKTSGGAVTTTVSNNAYVNGTAEKLVTSAEKEIIADLSMRIDTDSRPRLTLRGNNGNSEVLVNKVYTDTNGAHALPVFYDNNDDEFKYVNADDSFVSINVGGGGDGPDLTDYPDARPLFIDESDGSYFPCKYSAGDQTLVDVPQDVFFNPNTYADNDNSSATLVLMKPDAGVVYCHDSSGDEQIIDNVFNPATFVDGDDGAVVLYDAGGHALYVYDAEGEAYNINNTVMEASYHYDGDVKAYYPIVCDISTGILLAPDPSLSPLTIQNIAYVGESNSRPAIYNGYQEFIGFLSTT